MPLLPSLTRAVDGQPFDPEGVAFFDLDRTLIDGYSVLPFVAEGLTSGLLRPTRLLARAQAILEAGEGGLGELVEEFLQALEGVPEADLDRLGERVFRRHLAGRVHPEARALMRAHRERGHRVVIVTSATRFQAAPIARALGVEDGDLLCTRATVDERGRLTGRWQLPGCWNDGKRLHARLWLRRHGGRLADAWFYTDSAEDLPLLEHVGHPVAVDADPILRRYARRAGWPLLRFRGRGPDLEAVVRSSMVLSGFYGSALAGASTFLFGGSLADAADVAGRTFGATGLTLAGVRLRVHGEQHLRAARGAVVVFNHQSALDALVMARLVRVPYVGVAKAELGRNPLLGPLLRGAGTVFVDRGSKAGVRQLAPAVDALRAGKAVLIAPEGTRSYGTLPAPFKRGAFYLAKRARVPILPVVIHNAADVLPRGSLLLKPRVPVEVTVLPPIDTSSWRASDLGAQADALHARYLEELGFLPRALACAPASELPIAV
ncbi:MAG: HAD-IB family hydrolase [Pseudomonadales bacterium]|jgi:putative phosphoserine phosphatase/1-acylglycerol-3-phosphate O-acyltransferase|nr:HAD-IB family hydrolase [Pseudomonadales bacterium]